MPIICWSLWLALSCCAVAHAGPVDFRTDTIELCVVVASPLALVPSSVNGGVISIQADVTGLGTLPGMQR